MKKVALKLLLAIAIICIFPIFIIIFQYIDEKNMNVPDCRF